MSRIHIFECEQTTQRKLTDREFCFNKIYFVTTTGFEPARLVAPPPQDGESTNFSTWPYIKKQKKLSYA